jgi:hypothetical protein
MIEGEVAKGSDLQCAYHTFTFAITSADLGEIF